MQIQTVLAAVSLTEGTDETLRQADAFASARGAALVVSHIVPEAYRVRVLFPQDAGVDDSAMKALEDKARTVVEARVAQVLGRREPPVSVELESGTPHAGILEVADRVRADLIVVGPGDTALRVARLASSPVLIARPSPSDGDVLGATDFSDPALPAVHLAADEASRRKRALRLLHSLDIDDAAVLAAGSLGATIPMPLISEELTQEMKTAARGRLEQALAECEASGETLVARGRPALEIVAEATASPTALVVVGTRGRSGMKRLMLGSVAEAVVDRAPCSVLVVPIHPDR